MNTRILTTSENDLNLAVTLLKNGDVVAIPTETVYGLGADATNAKAVRKIFEAKERPADNPLIVHISDMKMLEKVAYDIPLMAYKLAKKFWPGPLTMIIPKRSIIPSVTSGGLDTIGVRMPANPIARKLIELSGFPIAAPSANRSGYPSPTTAMHVFNDMNSRILAIVDGGPSDVGLESTVISFDNFETIRILRPGLITAKDLSLFAETVIIDPAVIEGVTDNQAKIASPGMKYKHYSPKTNVILLEGDYDKFIKYVGENNSLDTYSLIFSEDAATFPYKYITYGSTSQEQAHQLFSKLRELDNDFAKTVYVRVPEKEGIGLAIYNRLIRAAGFEVIKL